jgi:hypothetical protein
MMKLKYAIALLSGFLLPPLAATALETGSAGLEGPKASAEALNTKMNSQAAAFNAALNKIQKCNTEGKFYDPTHTDPAPDANGCWYMKSRLSMATGTAQEPIAPGCPNGYELQNWVQVSSYKYWTSVGLCTQGRQ